MKIKFILLCLLLINFANAQTYKADLSESKLEWTGKAAFNAYSLSGTLKVKSGSLVISNEKITATTLVINMKSLSSENKDLTKHLRSKDFFEVKKHTTATFEMTEPIDLSASSVISQGKLTIKNQTKDYSFPLTIKKVGNQYKVSGTLTINRTDFGIYYNSPNYFEGLKQQAIADDFVLKVDLVFE